MTTVQVRQGDWRRGLLFGLYGTVSPACTFYEIYPGSTPGSAERTEAARIDSEFQQKTLIGCRVSLTKARPADVEIAFDASLAPANVILREMGRWAGWYVLVMVLASASRVESDVTCSYRRFNAPVLKQHQEMWLYKPQIRSKMWYSKFCVSTNRQTL